MPLVAWETITQPAIFGELSITRFQEHATLLKLRCVT